MALRSLPGAHSRGGFTLIELLVVMAIIATLAGIGIVGIPRVLRQADVTGCQGNLKSIFEAMMIYQTRYKALPDASGPAFVLAVWDAKIVDHTDKDAEIFACPSMSKKVRADEIAPETIHYTGPDLEGRRKGISIQDRNAQEKVIICDRVPLVHDDSDLDLMPHANTGLCYLTLGGSTEWIDAAEFGPYMVIGPESPIEKFKWLVPDEQ